MGKKDMSIKLFGKESIILFWLWLGYHKYHDICTATQLNKKKRAWRNRNEHNNTVLVRNCNIDRISVGNYTYGPLAVHIYGNEGRLKIGNFCSIAANVDFFIQGNHNSNTISTFPFKVMVLNQSVREGIGKGDIIIDDDVWIGYGAKILDGVNVGQGAIIGVNSVVTKDVPPYAIVAGAPARVIRYRFSPDIIKRALNIDYSKWTESFVREHVNEIYNEDVCVLLDLLGL